MPPSLRLTKRKKKGIAFRERKYGRSKDETLGTTSDLEDEANVPGLEDQVTLVDTQGQQSRQIGEEPFVWRGKTSEGEEGETQVVVPTKRKKTGEEAKGTSESDEPKSKRRKGFNGRLLDDMEKSVADHGVAAETGKESEKTKQRFILFLGNLKYTTTLEAIQAHFSVCVPSPTVRLLTPKLSTKSTTKSVTKSKGCAFLEFRHRGALQQGLKLHHSELDGRQINVELTAGGGGKGSARMKKLKERNKELEGQRRKRQHPEDVRSSDGQRSLATSGAEQTHARKRAWIVSSAEEMEGRYRHQKGSKKRRPLAREFRTGVNAIPVG